MKARQGIYVTLLVVLVIALGLMKMFLPSVSPVRAQNTANPGQIWTTIVTVPSSGTPTFDGSTGTVFLNTITSAIAPVVKNFIAGAPYYVQLCQDSVGGHAITPPSNLVGIPGGISTAANTCFGFTIMNFGGTHYQVVGFGVTTGLPQ